MSEFWELECAELGIEVILELFFFQQRFENTKK